MAEPPLQVNVSRHFLGWLEESRVSLAFTTYQTNRLFLIGLKEDGRLSVFERNFDRPMGLHATPARLLMSTRWQIWQLDDALPEGDVHEGFDRVYVPRVALTTGELDTHDVAVDREGRLVFVNTAYSCLATTSTRYSFAPIWKPPFISRLVPEDRCHLNGLAMADGRPEYVTTISKSDVSSGWRDRRHAGGCVIEVETGQTLLDNLSMPHSPRLHNGLLWLLQSGTGELGYVDTKRGAFEPVAFCPGYLRGLAFAGDYAIVGLSKSRRERAFTGLALDERIREKEAEERCGLWVIDLKSGVVAHWLELEGVVIELYDVQVLPGVRRPMAVGFKSDEIQRLITIDVRPRPIFQALAPPPASATSAPRATPAAAVNREAAQAAYEAANALVREGKFEQAVARYVEALVADPRHLKALLNLGTAQAKLEREDAALDCFRRALEVDPRSVLAHTNAAAVHESRGDFATAVRHYRGALDARPDDPDLLVKLWQALYIDGRVEEARAPLERAIRVRPDFAAAHDALGALAGLAEDFDAALRHHQKAAELDPASATAHLNVGKVHDKAGRIDAARAAYARSLALRDDPVLRLRAELLCPPVFASAEALEEYRGHANAVLDSTAGQVIELKPADVQSSSAESPFDWAYHGRDNLVLRKKYAALVAPRFESPPLDRAPAASGPWRVGFVVTPGHEGIFARTMAGVVDRLDRRRFEVVLACSRMAVAEIGSAFRNRAITHVDLPLRFDLAVEALRKAACDLLYYWEVGTDATNYFLPFHRLAPVQATGWGWPETSGAPELDYHVTSEELSTPADAAHYSERLFRLAGLPACMPRPPVAGEPSPPAHLGLPEGATRYVCAQTLRKIHPDFDAVVGGILRRDPRGVAVFVADKHVAPGELLRARWRERLPDVADRVRLVPRLSPDDYFRLVASADVALDPIYFGGAVTAYDSLGAGVPVVTLPGELPRGRYAAALCRRLGLEECVASSVEDYVARAVAIGCDRELRARLSAKIRDDAALIFDDTQAAPSLERFFAEALGAVVRS